MPVTCPHTLHPPGSTFKGGGGVPKNSLWVQRNKAIMGSTRQKVSMKLHILKIVNAWFRHRINCQVRVGRRW